MIWCRKIVKPKIDGSTYENNTTDIYFYFVFNDNN